MGFFSKKEMQQRHPSELEVHSARVYAELATMPQFIEVSGMGSNMGNGQRDGLLNLLTGCLVTNVGNGLCLTWQVGGYETTAHAATISNINDLVKFESLMRRQAA